MSTGMTQEQRGSSALKSGVWYTISSISVKAILIITTPIFTRLLTTSDYGLSATFTTWFTLFNIICSLNVWYSIGRAKLDFPGRLDEFVGSIQTLAFLFTLCISGFVIINLSFISKLLDMPDKMTIALIVYLLAYPAVQLTQQKYKYTYNYKGNIAITVYTTVSTIVLSLLFVFLLPLEKALGKSLGAVISAVIFALFVWGRCIRTRVAKINLEYWKYALIISVPLIFNSISLNILAQSDRIFIKRFCGSGYTGIYSLAYSYAILINIILNSINHAWLPWFHDTFNDENFGLIKNNAKPLVLCGCWIGVGCIAIAPEAILLLGGKSYLEGIWVVPPVVIGIICNYIFEHYEHIEIHLKKTWYISEGTMAAAVINILLNYIFIPRYGFVAAAYTTMFCYFLLMIFHHFISKKILHITLYDDIFMYLCIVGVVIISVFYMMLYDNSWMIRWFFIIIMSVLYLYHNRNYIHIILLKMMRKKRS